MKDGFLRTSPKRNSFVLDVPLSIQVMIRKQFRDTCKIQTRQYKALKAQVLQTTPKDEQKIIIRKLKEEQRRKMALLGEQYEQTIADMLQKQSVRMTHSLFAFF